MEITLWIQKIHIVVSLMIYSSEIYMNKQNFKENISAVECRGCKGTGDFHRCQGEGIDPAGN